MLETGVVLLILTLLTPMILQGLKFTQYLISGYLIGQKVSVVKEGFEDWVIDNYQTLHADITANGPKFLHPREIEPSGSIDPIYFRDNAVGSYIPTPNDQQILFFVVIDAQDKLQGWTYLSGPKLSRVQLMAAGWAIGVSAGYSSNSEDECFSGGPPCIAGIKGSWTVPYSTLGLTTPPPYATLVSVSSFTEKGVLSPYIVRFDIGDPEAQTMHTDLNMSGQMITAVKDIYLEDRGVWMSETAASMYIVGQDQEIDFPVCPENAPNPKILLNQQIWSPETNNYPASAVQVYLDPAATTFWRVKIKVITQDGQTFPGPERAVATAIVKCES